MIVLTTALVLVAVYLTSYVMYQVALFIANALIRPPRDIEPTRWRAFNVLVPAHNEQLHVSRLLRTLADQDYPRESYRVTVVADNCTDRTVDVCQSLGADVLERHDLAHTGKGHAIRWAVDKIGLERWDAIVIVDADSAVNRGFLNHLNRQMERGDSVIQVYNGVANPDHSWFTRLLNVSRTISNEILHPAKRKLGLSSHLMGNGMCFDTRVLREREWDAFSVGEDWEYYVRLIRSGIQVGYCPDARVYHQESVDLRQASRQRLRWSSGRLDILRRYGPGLLWQGIRRRDLRVLDAALPLCFPNPSLGMNLTLLGFGLALLHWWLGGNVAVASWYGTLMFLQLSMFVVGALRTRHKLASMASLVGAPVFLVWKMGIDALSLCGFGRKRWKATQRTAL